MNEAVRERLTAFGLRLAGSGAGIGLQNLLEFGGRQRLALVTDRLEDLGTVGETGISYLDLAGQIDLPELVQATTNLEKLSLPNQLNPVALGAGLLLAAASLFVDMKNGDWANPNLAKTIKFGGRLVQLALAGAVALTPQIITKAMEQELNARELMTSWEGWVALSGLAYLSLTILPAVSDGVKAGAGAYKRGERTGAVIWQSLKAAVRPRTRLE